MPDYATLKLAHVTLVALSGALFALRAAWRLRAPQRVVRRWERTVPHVVDTLLLAAGVTLALRIGALPGWLVAKLVLLPAYVVLGALALRHARAAARNAALAGAVAVYASIVTIAITKSPAGPLSLLLH